MAYWGGFASGLQAGSQTAARVAQTYMDAQEQAYRMEERQREADWRAGVKRESAPAEVLPAQTGIPIVDNTTGKTFYVSDEQAKAGALAGYGADPQRYTIGEAEDPRKFSEARVVGGKSLGQREITPEHAEMGYNPAVGLQEEWNKPENRFKRLAALAIEHDRPERAVTYEQLQTLPRQRELLEEEIKGKPGERAAREAQTQQARVQTEQAQHALEQARAAVKWRAAAQSPEAALKHYNENCPDGNCAREQTNPDGTKQIMVKNLQTGKEEMVGKPYKKWDGPDGGKMGILSNIPELANMQVEAELKHALKEKELHIQGKYHLDYARIMASARGQAGPTKAQQAEFDKVHADVMERWKAGKLTDEQAIMEINLAGAKIGKSIPMPKGADDKWNSMTPTDQLKYEELARAQLQGDPEFKKLIENKTGDEYRKGLDTQNKIVKEHAKSLFGGDPRVKGVRTGTNANPNANANPRSGGNRYTNASKSSGGTLSGDVPTRWTVTPEVTTATPPPAPRSFAPGDPAWYLVAQQEAERQQRLFGNSRGGMMPQGLPGYEHGTAPSNPFGWGR